MVIQDLVNRMRAFLREDRRETIWRTCQISGIRQESIKRIESDPISGTASSLDEYITSFTRRFPAEAKAIFNSVVLGHLSKFE